MGKPVHPSRPLPVEDEVGCSKQLFVRLCGGKERPHNESMAVSNAMVHWNPKEVKQVSKRNLAIGIAVATVGGAGPHTADDQGQQAVAATSGMRSLESAADGDVAWPLSRRSISFLPPLPPTASTSKARQKQ